MYISFFFFNDTATTEIYTLSLHDALPISPSVVISWRRSGTTVAWNGFRRRAIATISGAAPSSRFKTVRTDDRSACTSARSEEHTSELQSLAYLVCRLLLEKKKKKSRSKRP